MGVEIERKFLVQKEKWTAVKGEGVLYMQGYLLRQPDKTIRVRLVEGKGGYLTIKGKTTGFSRAEFEYAIPYEEAEELLHQFCEAIVTKKRYRTTVAGKLWEVDEFMGDNEGLLLAEIELETADEPFELPEWIAEEVTADKRYYNSELSVNPYKSWKP